MPPLTHLTTVGSPQEVGTTHGKAFAEEIRQYAADRIALSRVGSGLEDEAIIAIAHRMLDAHEAYDTDLFSEMVAMADACEITPAEAVIVGGYTDFIDTVRAVTNGAAFEDTCTAVITPDATSKGAGFLAQTWDMHASATPHVFILDVAVEELPRALLFTTHGTLGQIGMNDAGIAVGINNLTVTDGALGVTWPFVVRKALKQTTFASALSAIVEAPVAGAHSFLLFDATGEGAVIEATPSVTHVERLSSVPLVHTNHCVAPETIVVEADRPDSLVRSSLERLADATELLETRPHTVEGLMALFADERSICRHQDPVLHYETSGAVIMRPRTGDLWACWGLPSQNQYEHFTLSRRVVAP